MRYLLSINVLVSLINPVTSLAASDVSYGIPKIIHGIDNPEDCASVGGYWDKKAKKCLDKPRK